MEERLTLAQVAEALGVKVSQISRLLKAIGERFELPGVEIPPSDDPEDYHTIRTFLDGSVYRSTWCTLSVRDGRLCVEVNTDYSGQPNAVFRLDEFIEHAKDRYTKHAYYHTVHFIAGRLPKLVEKALKKGQEMGKDLDACLERLKAIIAEFEEARE